MSLLQSNTARTDETLDENDTEHFAQVGGWLCWFDLLTNFGAHFVESSDSVKVMSSNRHFSVPYRCFTKSSAVWKSLSFRIFVTIANTIVLTWKHCCTAPLAKEWFSSYLRNGTYASNIYIPRWWNIFQFHYMANRAFATSSLYSSNSTAHSHNTNDNNSIVTNVSVIAIVSVFVVSHNRRNSAYFCQFT